MSTTSCLKILAGTSRTTINSKIKNRKVHPKREVVAAALVPVPRFVEGSDVCDFEGFDVIFCYLVA
jgi:hypothetical protein